MKILRVTMKLTPRPIRAHHATVLARRDRDVCFVDLVINLEPNGTCLIDDPLKRDVGKPVIIFEGAST
jgi:hypothetical protein